MAMDLMAVVRWLFKIILKIGNIKKVKPDISGFFIQSL
jgi:hypothetical protein